MTVWSCGCVCAVDIWFVLYSQITFHGLKVTIWLIASQWTHTSAQRSHNTSTVTLYYVEMKWNESGFRPPLCTYRLNWARRTSWGLWDDWGDTVLQTQDLKFEPWRSEAEHATSRSRSLPTHVDGEETFCVSFKPPRPGTEPRTLTWKAAVLTTTLGPPPILRVPLNTKHLYNICTMLDQRRRRWADVVQMLYICFVFAWVLCELILYTI